MEQEQLGSYLEYIENERLIGVLQYRKIVGERGEALARELAARVAASAEYLDSLLEV